MAYDITALSTKLRFDVDNGQTLCRSCHKKVHTEIGKKTRFSRNSGTYQLQVA